MRILLGPWLHQGVLDLDAVLVAGTNGKGSVCAFLESIFRAHGFKTGLYTSPHLVSCLERIRVGGMPAADEAIAPLVAEIEEVVERELSDATFFEIVTAVALRHFAEARVDVVVIEAGLGGRLDSTNVLDPLVSVLTSVGLEHTAILGGTEEAIALEKSGVSRRGRPFVVGPVSRAARQGVERGLQDTGARLIESASPLSEVSEGVLAQCMSLPWLALNRENLRTALHAAEALGSARGLRFTADTLFQGAQSTFWPGRFDCRVFADGGTFILDAAHNLHGFLHFSKQWNERFGSRKCAIVYGSFADKDWKALVPRLGSVARYVVFTQACHPRAVPAKELAEAVPQDSYDFEVCADPVAAVSRARMKNIPVVFIGSIALLGELMRSMKIDPFAPLVPILLPRE